MRLEKEEKQGLQLSAANDDHLRVNRSIEFSGLGLKKFLLVAVWEIGLGRRE